MKSIRMMYKTLPMIIILFAILGCYQGRPQKEYQTTTILKEDVVLQPGEWRSWPFKVVEKGSRINGSFSTVEQQDFDILLYVTDPVSKDSLQTSNTGSYNYRSIDSKNRHMTGVVKDLDPGDYYLLFRNESKDQPRTVRIRMYIEY